MGGFGSGNAGNFMKDKPIRFKPDLADAEEFMGLTGDIRAYARYVGFPIPVVENKYRNDKKFRAAVSAGRKTYMKTVLHARMDGVNKGVPSLIIKAMEQGVFAEDGSGQSDLKVTIEHVNNTMLPSEMLEEEFDPRNPYGNGATDK